MTDKIIEVVSDVLNTASGVVTPDSTFENTEKWDSLKHIEIVTAIEDEFDIAFSAEDIVSLTSIKVIADKVAALAG